MNAFDIPRSLDRKVHFFNPLGFESISNVHHKTFRAWKQYMNDKNWINAQETASIFRFSAENFESDLKYT